MKQCRDCQQMVSEEALACPNCGCPHPGKAGWDGWGYEYKSKAEMFSLPLVHISFKFRPNRRPVPAKGIIAIGQFAAGVLTISQFGVGVVSISQFTVAGYALAQFAIAHELIAQIGLYTGSGRGQIVRNLWTLLESLQ